MSNAASGLAHLKPLGIIYLTLRRQVYNPQKLDLLLATVGIFLSVDGAFLE